MGAKPRMMVMNKADLAENGRDSRPRARGTDSVTVSASTGDGLDRLLRRSRAFVGLREEVRSSPRRAAI